MSAPAASVVGVAGLGLIGGSFAKDLIELGHAIVGYDIDADACAEAMRAGTATHASNDIQVLEDCRAVLIAVPVTQTAAVLRDISALDMPNLIAICDAGSTKQDICAAAKEILGDRAGVFVPCHPIAGTEHSGIRAAVKGLFRDRRLIICEAQQEQAAADLISGLWEQCGARIVRMAAADHDRLFAAVSHLPHMLAYALVNDLGRRDDRDELLAHAASGFTDFTRIASSNPHMWRDICLANSTNLVREIDAYLELLAELRTAIEQRDGEKLHTFFDVASTLRDNWLRARKSE